MVSKKQDGKKNRQTEEPLSPEEAQELQMVLDRLAVQDPEGESLESYLQSLHQAFLGRERLIVALIEKLSRNPSQVGFRTLLALGKKVEGKQHKRAIKQAAYRFSQRGYMTIPSAAPPEKVTLIPREQRKSIAHSIPGEQGLWLVSALIAQPDFAYPIAVSVFAENRFEHLSANMVESSHRAYRDYVLNVSSHLKQKPCEIPIEHAARLFFEMLEFHGRRDYYPEVERARQLFKPFYNPEHPPYAYELMPTVEHPERHLQEIDIEGLAQQLDISWLLFSKEELLPYWEKINELDNPILVIPPEIQQERSRDLIKRAGNELCAGETRLRFQRFFEEQALCFKLSGRAHLATSMWVVAQHLQTSIDAGENPLIFQLMLWSMHHHWPKDFERGERDSEPFHQTDSGLIVPR